VLGRLLQRVSVWLLGRWLRRPVQGRVACDLAEGGVLGSEVPGSKVVVSNILGSRVLAREVAVGSRVAGTEILRGAVIAALEVGLFDEVGSSGVPRVPWGLAGEIGCGELRLAFAHHWASCL
jgi:hypothetical protein